MDNWDNLRYVLALYRHKTMSAASIALKTNVATVSRRIDKTSQDLGVTLFVKDPEGWKPTPAVMPLVDLAEEVDGRLATERNQREISRETGIVGRIRIAAPSFFNTMMLVPRLHEMLTRHPRLDVDIMNRPDPIGLGDADLLLRIGRPDSGRVVARRLATFTFRAYRSTLAPYPRAGWVSVEHPQADAPQMLLGRQIFGTEPNVLVALFEQKVTLMRTTGLAAVLPDEIAGQLADFLAVDDSGPTIQSEIWLVYHLTRRDDPAVRTVGDWIVDCFKNALATDSPAPEQVFDMAV